MIPGKTAIAVGPGIGTCAEARDVLEFALLKTTLPVVADADTFSIFAGRIADLRRPDHPTVYTPHPGEMARLLGCATAEVAADRPGCALRAAQDTTAVVVLKGAHTIVAAPDGRLSLNLSGTPAMAKAGVGDVLTGMLGAFLGMGMPPYEAACLAVYLHGRCGELAEGKLGTHGVMASDLIDSIPAAVRLACGDE
jgi:NAD(P)H-hydrate epimerase